jgi:hypothetical protein
MNQASGTHDVMGGEILGGGLAPHSTTNSFTITVRNTVALNSNQRLNVYLKAERTSIIRTQSKLVALQTGFTKMYIAHCTVHVSFQDSRRRDVANYYPTVKAMIDGFIDAGLLTDDDSKHLIGPDMRLGELGAKGHIGFHFNFTEVA